MAYVGNDPFQNKSVDTAQLADNAVTGEKIVDDITFDDITTTGNVSGSVSSTGSYGRVEATKVEGTLATAAQTNVTSVGTVTTGVWNSSFGTTSGTQISGSITATSSSIATRFDSRETDMTLATASIVSNESNMTLATASIAAITASISTTKTDISTNSANMTLATASIAAITASVSTAKTDISTNSANMTLATASIAAITASVSSLKSTSFAGTAGTETVFSGSAASTGSFGKLTNYSIEMFYPAVKSSDGQIFYGHYLASVSIDDVERTYTTGVVPVGMTGVTAMYLWWLKTQDSQYEVDIDMSWHLAGHGQAHATTHGVDEEELSEADTAQNVNTDTIYRSNFIDDTTIDATMAAGDIFGLDFRNTENDDVHVLGVSIIWEF